MAATPIQDRPKFAHWLWLRGIGPSEAAAEIDCSPEWVRRITLPFSHPERARPSSTLRRRIRAYTEGEVGITDWEPAQAVADLIGQAY